MAQLNPYISFSGQAREALEFYQSVLGGELAITTYGDVPGMSEEPDEQEQVMHGRLMTDDGLTIMAADTPSTMAHTPPTSGVTIAVTGGTGDMDYVRGVVEKLSVGASDVLPFEQAPWGDHYGQLTDRYGVSWLFDVGDE